MKAYLIIFGRVILAILVIVVAQYWCIGLYKVIGSVVVYAAVYFAVKPIVIKIKEKRLAMKSKKIYGVSIYTIHIKKHNFRDIEDEATLKNMYVSEEQAEQYAQKILEERVSKIEGAYKPSNSSKEYRYFKDGGLYALRYEVVEYNLIGNKI